MLRYGVQQAHTFRRETPRLCEVRYLLFLPSAYARQPQRWPLILFLHGAGERGHDLHLVKRHGIAKMVEACTDFPFIVVSPQCPPQQAWSTDVLAALLDEIEHDYNVDPDRLYITGLSMGGFGTWAFAIAYPDRCAAIAPICGGGDPTRVGAIRHLPVWAFHGAKDFIVPLRRSTEMVTALRQCGGNVRFTVYPDAGHDAWTETYANAEIYAWFLAHPRTHHVRAASSPSREPPRD
jgi:predicted peptidase